MYTISIHSPLVTFENSGGKGANLGKLALLNLPVPSGFILTTDAYSHYIAFNRLDELITDSISGIDTGDLESLERASQRIRSAFSSGTVPEDTDECLKLAYQQLGSPSPAVAVRSSATTEDLPELSFAGQQDTFLNVIGETQLRKAVVDCWSSLWTARAIGYRLNNAIPGESAALAVVVQVMVQSEISGVLFSANPLTGLLSETVIDATFGLGEALVSGLVEPDHFVMDSFKGEIKSIALGTKDISIRSLTEGGVQSIHGPISVTQTLDKDQLTTLVEVGQKIQKEFGTPQDIEWAYARGELNILQSRPITSLFPVPQISFDPLILWFSFGAVQGVMGPLTPLGQEALQRVILGVGKRLGLSISLEKQQALAVAAGRMWIKITDLLRNPIGKRVLGGIIGIGEPGTASTLNQLVSDPRMEAGRGRIKITTLFRILRFILPAIVELPRVIFRPERARDRFDSRLEAYLRTVHVPGGSDRFERLANFADFMKDQGGVAEALPVILPRFMPVMATSLASLNLIGRLLPPEQAQKGGGMMLALDVTRGLPRNVTTEMDLALWDTARAILADPAGKEFFQRHSVSDLANRYQEGALPASVQTAVQEFLDRYGMRGTAEIDLGQPRWREDPAIVIETLQSYLQIPPEAAPDRIFEGNARAAETAIEQMAKEIRKTRGGWIKEKLFRGAARRVRLLLGSRESPKFYAVKTMDVIRNTLLAIGAEYVAAGTIHQREDLFFLHVAELEALARQEKQDWQALIAGRRQAYERESRRRQIPRILVSDGRAFYDGVGAQTDTDNIITGSPVSPGVVEGIVRVVRNPRQAGLKPGEIMVCPGTDPAWTPLFMIAKGLIMEVGGMITHGSVVAREYGIPAVVGVHQATTILKDGQRIRLDGSSGTISLLDQ